MGLTRLGTARATTPGSVAGSSLPFAAHSGGGSPPSIPGTPTLGGRPFWGSPIEGEGLSAIALTQGWYRTAVEFGQDSLGGCGPDKGFGAGIVLAEMSIDRGLQVGDRAEEATADALPRHLGEEVVHRIEPGRRGRGEVKGPARMARQASTMRARSTYLRAGCGQLQSLPTARDPLCSILHILSEPWPLPPNLAQDRTSPRRCVSSE